MSFVVSVNGRRLVFGVGWLSCWKITDGFWEMVVPLIVINTLVIVYELVLG